MTRVSVWTWTKNFNDDELQVYRGCLQNELAKSTERDRERERLIPVSSAESKKSRACETWGGVGVGSVSGSGLR